MTRAIVPRPCFFGALLLLAGVAGAPLPAAASQRCEITVGVDGDATLGGLELRVGYASAPGTFTGSEDSVECVALAPGAYQSARDDEAASELDLGMISAVGVSLPSSFWRCAFDATGAAPVPGDFTLVVDDAITPDSEPVSVDASISDIACADSAVCGNGIVEGDEQCDTGGASAGCTADCQLTADSHRCAVGFRVNGVGTLGGVQMDVGYANANGQFEGSGEAVNCNTAVESALAAETDDDAGSSLHLAMISPSGVPLPAVLWRCVFLTSGSSLNLHAFAVSGLVATDPEAGPLDVSVSATSDCVAPYCGDGNVDPGEACDDGNDVDTDACTTQCKVAACGDGFVHAGVEQCDDGNANNGDCCTNACKFGSSAIVCRAAAGACDQVEKCTGTSGACPADTKKTSVCRAAAGVCDAPEVCDGSSNTCPADLLKTTVCRASAGACDVAESCTGSSAACPADAFQPSGTACTSDGNPCTTDQCNALGTCAHPNNTAACDDGLFCNGADTCSGGSCSQHAGNPCPGADGDSDCSESCLESADSCTANDPNGSACNDGNPGTSNDQCVDGTCTGSGGVLCGDANGSGTITTSDAQLILKKSVGQPVTCPIGQCDVNNSGAVTTADALAVLKKAVGQPVTLNCP